MSRSGQKYGSPCSPSSLSVKAFHPSNLKDRISTLNYVTNYLITNNRAKLADLQNRWIINRALLPSRIISSGWHRPPGYITWPATHVELGCANQRPTIHRYIPFLKILSQYIVLLQFGPINEIPHSACVTIARMNCSESLRWEFINENKKGRKQENKNSTKKVIKKNSFFLFFLVALLFSFLFSCFFDRFLGRVLVFLFSSFLVFFYKFPPLIDVLTADLIYLIGAVCADLSSIVGVVQ